MFALSCNFFKLCYTMSEIIYIFYGIKGINIMNTTSTTKLIATHIRKLGRGAIFVPKDFLNIAPRNLIDKVLSRLIDQNFIIRVSRGVYSYPKKHPILGYVSPSIDDVAKVIARSLDQKLQISGAEAANALGLSTQVPAKKIYYTDGLTRQIKVGNQRLQFKHASPKIMAGAGKTVGVILQAVRYLGKNAINDDIAAIIARQISIKDQKDIKEMALSAPDWAHSFLNRVNSYGLA